MRCPYCGGLNADRAPYCVNCGRDLIAQAPKQNQQAQTGYRQTPPYQQPRPGATPQGRPGPAAPQPPPPRTPNQPPYTQPSSYAPQTAPVQRPHVSGSRQSAAPRPAVSPVPTPMAPPIAPGPPPPPAAPAPFPPRTATQLHALESGALSYTVLESKPGDGRKKIVRIAYARCVPWQQVATLLKAFREQQEERFDTIIVQGVLDSNADVYSFTNGQLYYDRNVRLGSQITNRYQIETGNGFESDSIRIVINE